MRKKLMMKVGIAMAAMMIVIAGASPVRADQRLTATVPFDFLVGQSRLPAGRYVVTETFDPAVVSIASEDGHHFVFTLTIPVSPEEAVLSPELVFQMFGGEHFLARINAGIDGNREVPLTPATMERTLQLVASTH